MPDTNGSSEHSVIRAPKSPTSPHQVVSDLHRAAVEHALLLLFTSNLQTRKYASAPWWVRAHLGLCEGTGSLLLNGLPNWHAQNQKTDKRLSLLLNGRKQVSEAKVGDDSAGRGCTMNASPEMCKQQPTALHWLAIHPDTCNAAIHMLEAARAALQAVVPFRHPSFAVCLLALRCSNEIGTMGCLKSCYCRGMKAVEVRLRWADVSAVGQRRTTWPGPDKSGAASGATIVARCCKMCSSKCLHLLARRHLPFPANG